MRWAFVFSAALLVWMALERLAGLHDTRIHLHMYLTLLWAFPAIAIYVLAMRKRRKNHFPFSWKDGFKSGLLLTGFVTLLSPLCQWITSSFISPDYFQNVTAFVVNQGMMSLEEAKNQFNLGSYMVQSAFGALVMGILTSAVVALFLKRKPKVEKV